MIGAKLSHFQITAKLGEGGMGEVYRAEDTKLDREVAIKVLPEAFTSDAERFARFEREAKVLASLNHPNIAAIYELGEADRDAESTVHFLVMELVEGDDLADRLAKGPIPVDETLRLGAQIATGLEAAHAREIVHRDLKPANIKVTPDGQVKILDFGLAKTAAGGTGPEVDLSHSPTLTAQMTQAGTILGTAAYMSPEQARGQEVDGQTDIWALGVVLHEMLTGERTFGGETATDTIAAIIERQPDWEALPAETPPLVRSLLRRCLQKERNRRLHDVADAKLELEEALFEPPAPAMETTAQVPAPRSARRALPWVMAGGLLVALVAVTATLWITRGADKAATALSGTHLSIDLAEGTTLDLFDNPAMAISSNGRTLVWAADGADGVRRLYIRDLDRPDARVLDGTDDAYGPFFSPDGRWIAYFDQAEAQLEKVTRDGGVPTKICDTPKSSKGGTWGDRGEVVFSYGYDGGLARVPADGGAIAMLTEPDRNAGVKTHRFPQFLPGGHAVLFMIGDAEIATFNESRIAVLNLDTGEIKLLVEGGMSPRYAASGHLVFARQGTLMAAPFDPEGLEVLGPPTPAFEGLVTNDEWGYGQYAMALNGTLLYAPGGPEIHSQRLVQADFTGRVEPLSTPERVYSNSFDFSPDGRRLAITVTGANFDVWLWDRGRQILSRLTAGWNNSDPLWSPDGERLIFQADRRTSGASDFLWIPADGSGPAVPLYETLRIAWPSSWSSDGRHLAYFERDPETDYDIWILPIAEGMKPGTPEKLVGSSAREQDPTFSPDGRWLAYASDETGTREVYVRSFSGPAAKQQVSSGGGTFPQWGLRGDEIFYVDPTSSRMMRTLVSTAPGLTIGVPEALFDFESTSTEFRLSPDGEHFVFLQRGSQAKPITQLRIVFDWFDELEGLFEDSTGR